MSTRMPPTTNAWTISAFSRASIPATAARTTTGCAYGGEFYRTLMTIQMGPYLRTSRSSTAPPTNSAGRSAEQHQQGAAVLSVVRNWIWNSNQSGTFFNIKYPDGTTKVLDNPSEKSEFVTERQIFIERGAFGWDGPDGYTCQHIPNTNYNHARGYNCIYGDGHANWSLTVTNG